MHLFPQMPRSIATDNNRLPWYIAFQGTARNQRALTNVEADVRRLCMNSRLCSAYMVLLVEVIERGIGTRVTAAMSSIVSTRPSQSGSVKACIHQSFDRSPLEEIRLLSLPETTTPIIADRVRKFQHTTHPQNLTQPYSEITFEFTSPACPTSFAAQPIDWARLLSGKGFPLRIGSETDLAGQATVVSAFGE